MDPNETLRTMLDLASSIINKLDNTLGYWASIINKLDNTLGDWEDIPSEHAVEILMESNELAEGVLSLNSWIQKGGFMPELWTKKMSRSRVYYRFKGAPVNRTGGPWWYREFETLESANDFAVNLQDSGFIEEAKVLSGDLPEHDVMDIYPPSEAKDPR